MMELPSTYEVYLFITSSSGIWKKQSARESLLRTDMRQRAFMMGSNHVSLTGKHDTVYNNPRVGK